MERVSSSLGNPFAHTLPRGTIVLQQEQFCFHDPLNSPLPTLTLLSLGKEEVYLTKKAFATAATHNIVNPLTSDSRVWTFIL